MAKKTEKADGTPTTAVARVDFSQMTAVAAQESFTQQERRAFNEVRKMIVDRTTDTAVWYWELGCKLNEIHKAAQENAEIYGQQLIPRIAVAVGYKTPRQLHQAMSVVSQFGTKTAFMQYVKMRGEAGNTLSWSHIAYLAAVRDTDMRQQLAATTLQQCWTAEDLWKRVKALANRTPRGIPGGRIRVPTSVNACLSHVAAQASRFVHNVDNAWTGEAFDLPKAVELVPASKIDGKLLQSLEETRNDVAALVARAQLLADRLSAAIASALAKRQIQEDADEEQELDDDDELLSADDDPWAVEDADDDEGNRPIDPDIADDEAEDSINIGKLRNRQARERREAAKKRKRGRPRKDAS